MTELDRLLNSLVTIYGKLRTSVRERWQRDLPFSELLFDRWERAKNLGFGEGSSIYHYSYVYGDVKVGKNTWIGPYTLLDGTGGLVIGDYCSISAGVHIYTHDTVEWALSGGEAKSTQAPVIIGNCCYIGSQAVIAKGVSIGERSVIGACAFVNSDIPPFSIAVGSPCRIIGQVQINEFDQVVTHYSSDENQRH